MAIFLAAVVYSLTQVTMMWMSRRGEGAGCVEELPPAIGFTCGPPGEDDEEDEDDGD